MAPACSGDRRDGDRDPETAGCESRGAGSRGDGGTSGAYVFGCPECGQGIEVDASMRAAILSNGCPVCAEPAVPEYFESAGT